MTMIDPEQERRRLREFYASQLDGELEKVAKQAYELTEIAREELKAELVRRGLAAELVEVTPQPPAAVPAPKPGDPAPELVEEVDDLEGELEFRPLVTIRRYLWLPDALLAKCSLDSAGIQSFLTDENIVRIDWLWSNLVGGVKLSVDPQEADAANDVLKQAIPTGFAVEGVGEYEQPQCPNCGSLDINFQEVAPAAYLSLFLIPLPFSRPAWRCHACKAEWGSEKETSIESQPTSD